MPGRARRAGEGPAITPEDWLAVVSALRHRTLNRLQAALGWAQLEEMPQAVRTLEAEVREQALLSALLASAPQRVQRAFLRLLSRAERAGVAVSLEGTAQEVGRGDLRRIADQLAQALAEGCSPLRIALAPARVERPRD